MKYSTSFAACLHAVRIDAEGESTVTFKVPLSELATITVLAKYNQKLLDVKVVVK